MISPEKKSEIKRLLKRGEPEGELRERLKQEGCSTDEIESCFEPHKYDMRSWYLESAVLITIVGLVLLANHGNILILILGLLLFVAYFNEIKRLQKENNRFEFESDQRDTSKSSES